MEASRPPAGADSPAEEKKPQDTRASAESSPSAAAAPPSAGQAVPIVGSLAGTAWPASALSAGASLPIAGSPAEMAAAPAVQVAGSALSGTSPPIWPLASEPLAPFSAPDLSASPAGTGEQQPAAPPSLILPCPVPAGYEPLELLGRSSAGVLFQARQLASQRRVGILMLAGYDWTVEEQVRFRLQAHALAHVRHPHLVQVLETGTLPGWYFLVVEYVEGESLLSALRQGRWPPKRSSVARQAARLIADLAQAVQQAHQVGVCHGDIRPANILITSTGQPRLGNFPLGRRTGSPPVLAAPARLTGEGTPAQAAYLAPEQVEGHDPERLTPAVDVHALGAVLYELLVGQPPFSSGSAEETLRRLRLEAPLPPRRQQRGVPRDLEAICLKCLRKDPHSRYPTAAALAEDLERFLRQEPVEARPAGWGHRLVLHLRRRPLHTGLGLLLGLILLTGASGGWWCWWSGQAAPSWLVEILPPWARPAQPAAGPATDSAPSPVLRASQHQLEEERRLLQKERQQLALERQRWQQEQAAVASPKDKKGPAISDPHLLEQLRQQLAKALEERHRLGEEQEQLRQQLAQAQQQLALLTRMQAHSRQQETATRQQLVRQLLAVLDALLAPAEGTDWGAEGAPALPAAALSTCQAFYQSLLKGESDYLSFSEEIACRRRLGDLLRWQGQQAAAEQCYRQALARASEGPQERGVRAEWAQTWGRLADLLASRGSYAEAEQAWRQALALDTPASDSQARCRQVVHLVGLAEAQRRADRWSEAAASYRQALEQGQQLATELPAEHRLPGLVAQVRLSLAELSADQGQLAEASMLLRQVLATAAPRTSASPGKAWQQLRAAALVQLAAVQRLQADAAARQTAQQAVDAWQQLLQKYPDDAACREGLAQACNILGRVQADSAPREAERCFRQAETLCRQVLEQAPARPDAHHQLGEALHYRAGLLAARGELAAAVPLLTEAIQQQQAALQKAPYSLACRRSLRNHYSWLAEAQLRLGNHRAAHEAAVHLAEVFPRRWQDAFLAATFLCRCLTRAQEPAPPAGTAAEEHARAAVALLRQALAHGLEPARLRQEPALAPLRARADFQQLLPPSPPAGGSPAAAGKEKQR